MTKYRNLPPDGNTAVTGEDGTAGLTISANNRKGPYEVTAAADGGAPPATFAGLSNTRFALTDGAALGASTRCNPHRELTFLS